MAGALTERDFVAKLERAGFEEVEVHERTPLGIDDVALYPLFTSDVLRLMRDLVPVDRRDRIATAVVLSARLAESA